jgi:hypothetical protein
LPDEKESSDPIVVSRGASVGEMLPKSAQCGKPRVPGASLQHGRTLSMQWKIFRPGLVLFVVAAAGALALAAAAQEPAEPQVIEIENGREVQTPVAPGGPRSVVTRGGVEVGQPTRIVVTVGNRPVRSIGVDQAVGDNGISNESTTDVKLDGEAKIVAQDATTRTIEVTPLAPGTVKVGVYVAYEDGDVVVQVHTLHVNGVSKGLTKFYVDMAWTAISVVIGDEEHREFLQPEVYYSSLKYPIYLKGLEQVRLTIQQSATAPVISVDSDGIVHGLRPGKATVTGSYGGLTNSVEVIVYTKENDPARRWHLPAKK